MYYRHRNGLLILLTLLMGVSITLLGQTASTIPSERITEIEADTKSADRYAESGDYNQAAFHYTRAANVYWVYGYPQQAIDLFRKAIICNERIGNHNAIYVLATNIGLIYSDMQEYQQAQAFFAQATQKARQLNRKQNIASALVAQAEMTFHLARYSESIKLLSESEAIAREINDPKILRNTYSILSQVYDRMGQREKAKESFDLFTALSNRIQQEEMQRKEEEANRIVSHAQSRVFEVEGELKATEQELIRKELELLQKQRVLELAEQESKQRMMQIELLSKERELQESIIKQQMLYRNIYLGIIVTVIVIAALIYYNYKQKIRANQLLQQKNVEISRQNAEIQHQAEQLRELNHLKDKLFSIISHDLRSPLGSLVTLLNLTKQGYFTEEGFKEVINELSTNVGYTSALLENLLKWAQSQMQGIKVNPSAFELRDVVNERIPIYQEHLARKQIQVDNRIDAGQRVYADRDMIDLVVRNLLSNAIKFSHAGNRVTFTSQTINSTVELCISDTGKGMSPQNLNMLFGKKIFSTLGTSDEKGTGLGLILCKDFVMLNGGTIWAESIEGKGSKFYFTLPKA